MFDILPKTNLRITALDVNVSPAGHATIVTVYYRQGSSFGYEGSSSGWTLLGTQTVIAAGQDLPTHVDLSSNNVEFLQGQTNGLYVYVNYSSGSVMRYTNGSNTYQDACIRLITNCGKGDPPFTGGTFFPRIWNGAIYYEMSLGNGLVVSQVEGLASQGSVGGPFSPPSKVYTLTNAGGSNLIWAATWMQSWVTVGPVGGTLAAGTTTNVTVSINSVANSLPLGSYNDVVAFTNLTTGVGTTNRTVTLTVNTPGVLAVTPATGLTSTGSQGGPFTPSSQNYTMSNTGGSTISWSATNTTMWVTLSATNGLLAAGSNTMVTVSINANANALPLGSYSDNVAFVNLSTGIGSTNRNVNLNVNPFGALDHFVWNPISSPQHRDTPLAVTVIAQDAGSNTVTSFTGPVAVSGLAGSGSISTNTMLGNITHSNSANYGTFTLGYSFTPSNLD
jgi:hypothetical protein